MYVEVKDAHRGYFKDIPRAIPEKETLHTYLQNTYTLVVRSFDKDFVVIADNLGHRGDGLWQLLCLGRN